MSRLIIHSVSDLQSLEFTLYSVYKNYDIDNVLIVLDETEKICSQYELNELVSEYFENYNVIAVDDIRTFMIPANVYYVVESGRCGQNLNENVIHTQWRYSECDFNHMRIFESPLLQIL